LGNDKYANWSLLILTDLLEVNHMPLIRISWWAGRTHEQKMQIAKAITDIVAKTLDISPDYVWIFFDDIPKEDWTIGGVPGSEMKV